MEILGTSHSRRVWIVGSSLIRNAYQRARLRPDGANLGLKGISGSILWEFKGGMSATDLKPTLEYLLEFEQEPKINNNSLRGKRHR